MRIPENRSPPGRPRGPPRLQSGPGTRHGGRSLGSLRGWGSTGAAVHPIHPFSCCNVPVSAQPPPRIGGPWIHAPRAAALDPTWCGGTSASRGQAETISAAPKLAREDKGHRCLPPYSHPKPSWLPTRTRCLLRSPDSSTRSLSGDTRFKFQHLPCLCRCHSLHLECPFLLPHLTSGKTSLAAPINPTIGPPFPRLSPCPHGRKPWPSP